MSPLAHNKVQFRTGNNVHSRGFTLIEAIVAVAIVGIALVPIIIFVSQMVSGLARAGDANARHLAQQSLIEFLEPLNPLEQPVGEDRIGDLIVRWQSSSLIPPNPVSRVGSGLAGFSMGFYNVTISVDRVDAGPWFSFDMRKVGYRRINFGNPMGEKP
jgi:general secretion pathway protein I